MRVSTSLGSPRLSDIARDLGVSKAAVSKALRDAPDISPALKARVLEHARKVNYQPDLAARSLATRRTFSVGLVVPDITHSFFADIAKAVARHLHPKGYTLVLADSEEDPALEQREVEQLLARRVDGIILASSQPAGELALLNRIRKRRVPLVLVDREFPGFPGDYSGVNNTELGRIATEHVIRLGRRVVAHLACAHISTGVARRDGYRRALAENDLSAGAHYEVQVENSDAGGYTGTRELLERRPLPDALFCFSDPVAAGAERALLEAGLDVPRDIALVGAGNLRYSDQLRVPLSTVDMQSVAMGDCAAGFLLARMEGGQSPPQSFYAPLRVLERESTVICLPR